MAQNNVLSPMFYPLGDGLLGGWMVLGERWRLLGMIFNNWMSGNKVLKWAFGQKALLLLLWVLGAHRTVQSFMGKHILCDRVLIHSGGS